MLLEDMESEEKYSQYATTVLNQIYHDQLSFPVTSLDQVGTEVGKRVTEVLTGHIGLEVRLLSRLAQELGQTREDVLRDLISEGD